MVQATITISLNFDFRTSRFVPTGYLGKVQLNTAMGQRLTLDSFDGFGGMDEAQARAMAWIFANMLEHNNPSCRPLRYAGSEEQ